MRATILTVGLALIALYVTAIEALAFVAGKLGG